MSQFRFISYNKYTTVVGDADNGGVYVPIGVGMHGNSILYT